MYKNNKIKWYYLVGFLIVIFLISFLASLTAIKISGGIENNNRKIDSVYQYNYNSDTIILKTKDSLIIIKNEKHYKETINWIRDSFTIVNQQNSDSLWNRGLQYSKELLSTPDTIK